MDNAILARKPPLRRRLTDPLPTDRIAALMTQDRAERRAYMEIIEDAIAAGELEPCPHSATLFPPGTKFYGSPTALSRLHWVRGSEIGRWIKSAGEKLARFPGLDAWVRDANANKKGTVQLRLDVLLRVLEQLEADGHDRWSLRVAESELLALCQTEASSKDEQKAHVVEFNTWRQSIHRATAGSRLYRVDALHNRAEGQRKKAM
jgi:hypothetical protein